MAKKILVVDDEPQIRRLLVKFLGGHGFQMLEASDGKEALTIFEKENPDLVFMDVIMPGLNGLQALKQIHQKSPATPVIMLSALYEEETAREAIEYGAYDYLTKPVDLKRLKTDFVDRILG